MSNKLSPEAPRKRKSPIKFLLQLNDEQKAAKNIILTKKVSVLEGNAGSGKTLLACQIGLNQLFTKEKSKIFITRPTVSEEDQGFLPGDIKDKMLPWLIPIYSNMYSLYKKEKIDKHINEGDIEIAPLQYMRGRTFVDSIIIVDEAQNITNSQMEMILTRLGKGSMMIICGDGRQNDLTKHQSGFNNLKSIANKIDEMTVIRLLKNHRDPVVEKIINEFQNLHS